MTARDHERYEQDAGAYVLGALSEHERQAFERHLAGCETCREDLEQLRVAAEALPRAVKQYKAPEPLKASLMATVRSEAAAGSAGEARDPARPRRPLLERLRRAPSPLRPRLAWAAAALAVLAIVAAGFYQLGERAEDDERTIAAQVDDSRAPEASGRLLIQGDESEGAILEVSGVPRARGREVLHVWLRRGDRVVRSSIFQVGPDGEGAAAIPDDLAGVDLVMVTREAGPVPAPTEDPLLTVRVRS